ncbi:MAG: hypothetical protein Q8M03_02945 [Legionella sp.]|nr:hypothetical protein [Legionella sp.]
MDNKSRQEQEQSNAHFGILAMITVVILSALFLYFLVKSPTPILISANTAPPANTPTEGSSLPLS